MFILINKVSKNFDKRVVFLWLTFFMVLFHGATLAEEHEVPLSSKRELRGGWYVFEPYQYLKDENGVKTLTGLDFQLAKEISNEVGVKIKYDAIDWDQLLEDIEVGKKDIALGAIYSDERAKYAYFSVPYRYEEDSLFANKDKIKDLEGKSLSDLFVYFKKNKFKLGVINKFIYSDPLINKYITDPQNQDLIVRTENDYENIDLLLNKEIDGFIEDRIVGATSIWRMDAGKNIVEHRLNVATPIHIIFSKKSVSEEVVNRYNEAIEKLINTEKYQKIVSWYIYPAIFLQIEDAEWFKITEIIGVIAFAISGLIIAFKEKATLFGALILAILPSLGGSLMRDVIFGRNPVGTLQSPIYLSTVLLTVVLGFFTIKLLTHFRRHFEIPGEIEDLIQKQAGHILIITDAIGLAMFTVTGVIVSLLAKADPLWLWGPFFAFITGAGGGILRDMISKTRYIAALEGELYGEIAIIWGFILSVYIMSGAKDIKPEYLQIAVIVTILGVFFTRLIVHFMRVPNAKFGRHE